MKEHWMRIIYDRGFAVAYLIYLEGFDVFQQCENNKNLPKHGIFVDIFIPKVSKFNSLPCLRKRKFYGAPDENFCFLFLCAKLISDI